MRPKPVLPHPAIWNKLAPMFQRSCLSSAAIAWACFALVQPGLAQTWTQTSAPTNLWSSITCSADGSKVVAVSRTRTSQGVIYGSTNSGVDWTLVATSTLSFLSVASSADGARVIAATSGGPLFVSSDSGVTWSTNSPNHLWTSVASSADGLKLAAVYSASVVFLSTNGGATWSSNVTTIADLFSIASSADGRRLIAGNNVGRIAISTNGGAAWAASATQLSGQVLSLASSADGRRLVAVTSGAHVYTSADGGNGWATGGVPANSSWFAAGSSADGTNVVVVSQKTGIFSSPDAGATWASNSAPALNWQAAALSADGGRRFALGQNLRIWKSETIVAPLLSLGFSGGNIRVSWLAASTPLVLQEAGDLTSSWAAVSNVPSLNVTNLLQEVGLPMTTGARFYRLATP
jgi:hypothetical protein